MSEIEFTQEHVAAIAELQTDMVNIKEKVSSLNNIENAIVKISTLLEVQSKDNEKRDALLIKQSEMLTQQSITMAKVNDNLDNLNIEVKNTNCRIDKLENKYNSSEEKCKVDLRDVQKEEIKLSIGQKAKRVVFPVGALAGILAFLYELILKIKDFSNK